jgi:hypothetical protein
MLLPPDSRIFLQPLRVAIHRKSEEELGDQSPGSRLQLARKIKDELPKKLVPHSFAELQELFQVYQTRRTA